MDVRSITGNARSVSDLLTNRRYGLEFYQREYAWERSQVEELVKDLTARFEDEHEEQHERVDVANYREYFLGPIITTDRDGTRYLIDGQQRCTTLTLLLIVLRRRLAEQHPDQAATVQQLVFTEQYGNRSLTVDVPEREPVIQALIDDQPFDTAGQSASVQNVAARFGDLDELLEPDDAALPLFTDWLLNKVILVEITAPESNMAYDIFETMNDRGLRLSPTDMLKGYLLASIRDEDRIASADDFWRGRILELEAAKSDADVDFFKAWLRAHYADSIRERRKGAASEDWDLIGTQFHKWVRDKADQVQLRKPGDFHVFVRDDFDRMSRHYLRLLDAGRQLTAGLEHFRYATATGYSLPYTVVLAPVRPSDDVELAERKMDLVSRYLSIFVARRIFAYRNYGYSPTYYAMFLLAKRIRHAPLDELVGLLRESTADQDGIVEEKGRFGLSMRNGPQVKYVLARLTSFLEEQVHGQSIYDDLLSRDRNDPFEIEHVWANKFERFSDVFEHEHEFGSFRNGLGGLLLLPKSFNASYGALPYEEKLQHYRGQNVLAASLHPDTYSHNPNLRRALDQTGVDLRPHATFERQAFDARHTTYLALAEFLWDPDRLLVESDA